VAGVRDDGAAGAGSTAAPRPLPRLIRLLDTLLAQWDAYDADQALPPPQRVGIACPAFVRASCLTLRARYVAALASQAPDAAPSGERDEDPPPATMR
jgi:hypothetical protein